MDSITANVTLQSAPGLSSVLQPLCDGLCAQSRCSDWGILRADFERILLAVGAKYLPEGTESSKAATFFKSLKVEELALARGCAAGHERAWEVFLTRYREKLFEMALSIAREAATARELADSLYADLYGVNSRGERVSKLASYTGRGSLEGWLRTVLAQEFVNRYRKQRRTTSLDEEIEQGRQFAAQPQEAAAVRVGSGSEADLPIDPRLDQSITSVLDSLTSEDRYVLASYFLDGRTLAEVARTLGVHESTISRRVDKLARGLRKQILSELGRRGMTRRQAEECLDTDVRDLRVDLRARLTQESRAGTFSPREAGETPK
jgi:RNA polymerase sigma-70 factor (ECF subfamily)